MIVVRYSGSLLAAAAIGLPAMMVPFYLFTPLLPMQLETDYEAYLQSNEPGFVEYQRVKDLIDSSTGLLVKRRILSDPGKLAEQIELIYYCQTEPCNIFTSERLHAIRDFERLMEQSDWYQRYCSKSEGKCSESSSVLNFFFPTLGSNGEVLLDGNGPLLYDIDTVLSLLASEGAFWFVSKSFLLNANYSSVATRTGISLEFQSSVEFESFISESLLPFFESNTFLGEDIRLVWYNPDVFLVEISRTIYGDVLFAGLSIGFVFLVIWFHTRSVFITMMGVYAILLSYPLTYIFYSLVFGIEKMMLFNFTSVFVVIGLGADDIFVFCDFWWQSTSKHEDDIPARLKWTFKNAAGCTLVTTLTTAASFFANLFSAISPVRDFGIFMGVLVLCNYLNMLLLLPLTLVSHDKLWNKSKLIQLRNPAPDESTHYSLQEDSRSEDSGSEFSVDTNSIRKEDTSNYRWLYRCFRTRVGPFVYRFRYFLVVIFICINIASLLITIPRLEIDDQLPQIFSPTSNLGTVQELRRSYFLNSGFSDDLGINTDGSVFICDEKLCTGAPTAEPTVPTISPTTSAPFTPSNSPTLNPVTNAPTRNPITIAPTRLPTRQPTNLPTTRQPTLNPTVIPSAAPTTCSPSTAVSTSVPSSLPTLAAGSGSTKSPTLDGGGAPTTSIDSVAPQLMLIINGAASLPFTLLSDAIITGYVKSQPGLLEYGGALCNPTGSLVENSNRFVLLTAPTASCDFATRSTNAMESFVNQPMVVFGINQTKRFSSLDIVIGVSDAVANQLSTATKITFGVPRTINTQQKVNRRRLAEYFGVPNTETYTDGTFVTVVILDYDISTLMAAEIQAANNSLAYIVPVPPVVLTTVPTSQPTSVSPTSLPITGTPSILVTRSPTLQPSTLVPTTISPSVSPSLAPSSMPSASPTAAPTLACSALNYCNKHGVCVRGDSSEFICECDPGYTLESNCSAIDSDLVELSDSETESIRITWTSEFVLLADTQVQFVNMCEAMASEGTNANNTLHVRRLSNCVVGEFWTGYKGENPNATFPIEDPQVFQTELKKWLRRVNYVDGRALFDANEKLIGLSFEVKTSIDSLTPAIVAFPIYEEWESKVKSIDPRALQTSLLWGRSVTEIAIVEGTLISGIASISAAAFVILLFTKFNIVLTLLTTLAIVTVLVILLFFIVVVVGRKFGAIEAISMIIFVGMAVDYSLHVAHSYSHTCVQLPLKDRVALSLARIGPSVLFGAITTGGAGAVLIFCDIVLFKNFGLIITMNTFIALFVALFYLPPLITIWLETKSKCRRETKNRKDISNSEDGDESIVAESCSPSNDDIFVNHVRLVAV